MFLLVKSINTMKPIRRRVAPAILLMIVLTPIAPWGCGGGSGGNPSHGAAAEFGPVGSMSRSYLTADRFTRVVLEVDQAPGAALPESSLQFLRDTLESLLRKPVQLDVATLSGLPSDSRTYSARALRELSQSSRRLRSSRDTAVMQFLVLNGASDNPDALAVAFNASCAAIFPDKLAEASGGPLSPPIAPAVLVHEAGHLLGLVDVGAPLTRPHEDTAHPLHCTNRSCVMYWAVESRGILGVLLGGPPTSFDADCQSDLEAVRG